MAVKSTPPLVTVTGAFNVTDPPVVRRRALMVLAVLTVSAAASETLLWAFVEVEMLLRYSAPVSRRRPSVAE